MPFYFTGSECRKFGRIALFSQEKEDALRLFCGTINARSDWKQWQEFEYAIDSVDGSFFFRAKWHKETVVHVDRDFTTAIFDRKCNETELINLLFHVFRYYLIKQGNVCAHGAAIVNHGAGVLFCGLPGAGKSTQANLWNQHTDSWGLNYDKPAILFEHDNAFVAGTPWSGKENRYINHKVPLHAIVFVNQDSRNYVQRLSQVEAYALIRSNFMTFPISEEMAEHYDDIILRLVATVPVYNLYATISEEAVEVVYSKLFPEYDYLQEKGQRKAMRICDGFKLRKVADEWIVIPRGAHALSFNGSVLLNDTGAFVYQKLEAGITFEQLVSEVASEYLIDMDVATRDVTAFLEMLRTEGMLEE